MQHITTFTRKEWNALSVRTLQKYWLQEGRIHYKKNITICLVETDGVAHHILKTNALGAKVLDTELNDKPTINFYGDSVAAGISGPTCSPWNIGLQRLAQFSNYQINNFGVSGANWEQIKGAFFHAQRQLKVHNLKAKFNIIAAGWHSLHNNRAITADLKEMWKHHKNLVLCTMPTALNPNTLKFLPVMMESTARFEGNLQDVATARLAGEPVWLQFWGDMPYSPQGATSKMQLIHRHNQIMRELSGTHNIPLVDFYEFLKCESQEQMCEYFRDIGHPSLGPGGSNYSHILNFWAKRLGELL